VDKLTGHRLNLAAIARTREIGTRETYLFGV